MSNEIDQAQFSKCVALRKALHQEPETAFEETQTAQKVLDFLEETKPDRLEKNIGGYGILAFYQGKRKGKTLLFRSELDALPIAESNTFEHRSKIKGKAHKCGHDGHMSILAALALMLEDREFPGTVILLFQPAEETGEGALAMMKDKRWKKLDLKVDQAYALHNLPGYDLHQVILRKDVFAAASKGMIVKLNGKPSHAAHPMNGINPSLAIAQIVQSFYEIPQMFTPIEQTALITPIGMKAGQKAFGTSASEGEIYATIRTYENHQMEKLGELLEERVQNLCKAHRLNCEIEWVESFPAVENSNSAVELTAKACDELGFDSIWKDTPFSWSEDFGQFAQVFPSCMFGLGSGKESPQLHNEDYDFPDELIKTAAPLFYKLIQLENE
ncbi:MAG: amidohydrolase [Vicingaceae bacterium]